MMNLDGVGGAKVHGINVSHCIVEFDDVGLTWYVFLVYLYYPYMVTRLYCMVRMQG